MNIDYYTQHSPVGAYASFTCGRMGRGGGFGLQIGRPAQQDLIVAYRIGETIRALPWFRKADAGRLQAARYQALPTFAESEIARDLQWATDTWTAGKLLLRLYTPFGHLPDPLQADPEEIAFLLCPVLVADLELDNRDGVSEARLYFGVADPAVRLRPLADVDPALAGVAGGMQWALGAWSRPGGGETSQDAEMTGLVDDHDPVVRRLSSQGGLLWRVPAGRKEAFTLALGFFRPGPVTTGMAAEFYYTRFFRNLEEVVAYGLVHADRYREVARDRDRQLQASGLSPERRWLISQATRNYYANTELLVHGRNPIWIVNEGEYQMMNTLDLTVDHLFFEMLWHPWTVRNCLDLMADRYRYDADVQDVAADRRPYPGGISFTHDMGVQDQFSPPGQSAYEHPGTMMTHEELCNWVLCAAVYALEAGDAAWLRRRQPVFRECLQSLVNRDHHDEHRRDGIMDLDTVRAGPDQQEITTYDCYERDLRQARRSLYLGVKTWAAYVCLEHVFGRLGLETDRCVARSQAARAAQTVAGLYDERRQYIPALLDGTTTSYVLPAVEGLIFPYLIGDRDAVSADGRFGDLVRKLDAYVTAALQPGRCIDPQTGGWRLSSASFWTEQAKIQLFQFVIETVLGLDFGQRTEQWDRLHVQWQQTGEARDWVPVTGLTRADTGEAFGSGRYYPRAVTAILFFWEKARQSGLFAGRPLPPGDP